MSNRLARQRQTDQAITIKQKSEEALTTLLQTLDGQSGLSESEAKRLKWMFESGYTTASIDALLKENVLLEAELSIRSPAVKQPAEKGDRAAEKSRRS